MMTTILVVAVVLVISAAYNREPKSNIIGSGADHENTQWDITRDGRRVVRYCPSGRYQVGSEYPQ